MALSVNNNSAALTALQNVAADHGEAQIRNRAADLLRTRKAAKELPK